jgi:hypothetical protein
MSTIYTKQKRDRLLQLAEEYRHKGYDVLFQPNTEDIPIFLQGYRPDLIVKNRDECAIVDVRSRTSLDAGYLQNIARIVEQQPGWRYEMVMANSEENGHYLKIEESLDLSEIEAKLPVARQLAAQHPESAILYTWSLTEATLRLVALQEKLSIERFDPCYLVKLLVSEGVISRAEYRLLMDALSLRDDLNHGLKTPQITCESAIELIASTETLLESLQPHASTPP